MCKSTGLYEPRDETPARSDVFNQLLDDKTKKWGFLANLSAMYLDRRRPSSLLPSYKFWIEFVLPMSPRNMLTRRQKKEKNRVPKQL